MNVDKITTKNKPGFYGFAGESHKKDPTKKYIVSQSNKKVGGNELSMCGGE